ncbi:MAG TPA: hypothetical protein DHV59_01610 [Oxalobacteraceae bacterium]|nr:hypothetical protein [Oxalobacteraceae bacterium]
MKQVSIRKNDNSEVRITRSAYKGRQVIDIRVWVMDKVKKEYSPSSKGVTIDAGKCEALIEALKAIA